jgi:hypothetical protein
MSPHDHMMIGIAAGLILATFLRWAPSWADLLTAVAVAILIDLVITHYQRRDLDFDGFAASHASDNAGSAHVCACIAVAFIGVLAVLHIMRAK